MKKSVGFMSENVLLMFFSKSFMVSCLTCRSLLSWIFDINRSNIF